MRVPGTRFREGCGKPSGPGIPFPPLEGDSGVHSKSGSWKPGRSAGYSPARTASGMGSSSWRLSTSLKRFQSSSFSQMAMSTAARQLPM